jgi:2,3-dihydroxybenzoate decarboxylase
MIDFVFSALAKTIGKKVCNKIIMTAKTIPKIAIEEAFTLPELAYQSKGFTGPNGGKDLATDLLDIQGRRIQRMDDNNVSFMVLSLTSPGPQDQGDAANALDLAQRANNYLAAQIKKKPDRLGGFASLSMHDPKIAATEARRAIEELGLHGIIVNDFQTTNANGNQIVFYDQPEWDHFWEELSRLDVPLYLHPRLTIPSVSEKFLSGRPWLRNSPYFFSVGMFMFLPGQVMNRTA